MKKFLVFRMKSSLSLSTESLDLSQRERPFQIKRRYYFFYSAGVLLAFLGGFLLGYLIPSEEKLSTNNVIDHSTWKAVERQLVLTLDNKAIENVSRSFSSKPHIGGSRRSLDLALEIKQMWKEFGFDVVLPTYEVLLSSPKPNSASKVELVDGTGRILYESSPHRNDDGVPVFLAYSSSGVVEGDLVYVNYGTQQDFEELRRRNISVMGKIAIIRYGRIFRGSKVAIATRWGAIGVLLYPDPANFAPSDKYYPQSWWLPPNATQLGSVYPGPSFGDPLTHGLPATPGMLRRRRDEVNLPKIPAHVLTYGEAEHFLKRMAGPEVPSAWRGGLNITYRFGPYFKVPKTKVRLNVNVENVVKKITNVIGTVNGSVEPDRIVLLGAHRDSWSYGAVDAVSATAVMIEISRAVGVLLKSGWRPRRTIQFCSWSAEEYALIGSTEWVEENSKLLSERAVAYLNLDLAVNGNFTLRTFSSPLLNQLILDALKDVTDPTSSSSSQSIYEVMANREPSAQGMKPKLRTLGTVSDYASFYQYLGIPSIDWGYYFSEKNVETFPYPVYHSSVETFEWVKKFVDPQFKIHLAVAQLGGIFLIRLVDCPVLPMSSVSSYTPILRNSLQVLEVSYQDQFRAKNITLVHLKKAVEDFGTASTKFEEHLNQLKNENKNDFAELRILNDQIRYIEKSFLYPNGLPGRSEFKHLIFAPNIHNTYASASYPGITDAIFECEQKNCSDWEEVRFQISLVTHTIQQATVLLKPIL